jgi:succinate dehydrogenase flavin-adding protein (antitoxin of CptAB toxin-antitoxin module)
MKRFFYFKVPKFNITLSNDINIARKQVFWRVRNMGQLELEVILSRWWEENHSKMNLDEMNKFTKEILEMEIPDLNKYFVSHQPAGEELVYISKIQKSIY